MHCKATKILSALLAKHILKTELAKNGETCYLNEMYHQYCSLKARPWIQQILLMVCTLVSERLCRKRRSGCPLATRQAPRAGTWPLVGPWRSLCPHRHPAAQGMCLPPLNTSASLLLTAKKWPELSKVFMSSFGLGLSTSILGFPGSIQSRDTWSHKQVISLRMVLIKACLCIVPLEFLFSWFIK